MALQLAATDLATAAANNWQTAAWITGGVMLTGGITYAVMPGGWSGPAMTDVVFLGDGGVSPQQPVGLYRNVYAVESDPDKSYQDLFGDFELGNGLEAAAGGEASSSDDDNSNSISNNISSSISSISSRAVASLRSLSVAAATFFKKVVGFLAVPAAAPAAAAATAADDDDFSPALMALWLSGASLPWFFLLSWVTLMTSYLVDGIQLVTFSWSSPISHLGSLKVMRVSYQAIVRYWGKGSVVLQDVAFVTILVALLWVAFKLVKQFISWLVGQVAALRVEDRRPVDGLATAGELARAQRKIKSLAYMVGRLSADTSGSRALRRSRANRRMLARIVKSQNGLLARALGCRDELVEGSNQLAEKVLLLAERQNLADMQQADKIEGLSSSIASLTKQFAAFVEQAAASAASNNDEPPLCSNDAAVKDLIALRDGLLHVLKSYRPTNMNVGNSLEQRKSALGEDDFVAHFQAVLNAISSELQATARSNSIASGRGQAPYGYGGAPGMGRGTGFY